MKDDEFSELKSLFFSMKQIIRSRFPKDSDHDPNAWLRMEILQFIAQSKEPTMHDIAAYLCVRAPSATSLVNNLARAGSVRRQSGKGDRRTVRVALTKKGAAMLSGYSKNSARVMREVFSLLDEDELRQLVAVLRRLRDVHALDANE